MEKEKILKIAVVANLFYVFIEVAVGFWANSLSIFSDAGHNFFHATFFGLTLLGLKISSRSVTKTKTYGYKKVEILIGFVNSLALIAFSAFVIYEGIKRFYAPSFVFALPVIFVSATDLVIDLVLAKMLMKFQENISIKGAFLDLLSDAGASVAVMMGGFLVLLTKIFAIDALIAIFVSLVTIYYALKLLRESAHLLIDGVPRKIKVDSVKNAISGINGVKGISDMHIWGITSTEAALSSHVLVDHEDMKDSEKILEKINKLLEERFNIKHITIQIDCINCTKRSHTH